VYANPSGRFTAGIKDGILVSSLLLLPANKLLHILEGEVTVTTDAGGGGGGCDDQSFVAGDTFLVPGGLNCHRDSGGDVLAIFCSWDHQAVK
jgi:hypothetical protein